MAPYEKALRLAQQRKDKGLPQTKRVYELLIEAERGGDARATYALATWYLHGSEFTKPDLRRATSMLRAAADADVSEANYDLAVSYEKGVGLKRSLPRAFEHYTKAALLGDAQSYVEVGRMLHYGIGVSRNRRLAKVWFDRGKALGVDIR